jgi:hypothetical protein
MDEIYEILGMFALIILIVLACYYLIGWAVFTLFGFHPDFWQTIAVVVLTGGRVSLKD